MLEFQLLAMIGRILQLLIHKDSSVLLYLVSSVLPRFGLIIFLLYHSKTLKSSNSDYHSGSFLFCSLNLDSNKGVVGC